MVNRGMSRRRRAGGCLRSTDFFRTRVESLEQRLLLSISPAHFVDPHQSPYEAALEAFHGPDLVGKDGPLAKIGFDLTLLYEQQLQQGVPVGGTAFTAPDSLLLMGDDQVVVDVMATGDVATLQSQLAGIGMNVRDTAGSILEGVIPVSALDDLAALGSVAFARAVYKPNVASGSVQSQGDAALGTDTARATFGVDGSGLTVGVLSDSFNRVSYAGGVDGVARDIATGDLPQNTKILEDRSLLSPGSATDEGRGMAQLIHDVAPGAAIQFATADGGEAHFASNILALAAAGSDVIVDDVGYFAEPFFQDGLIARAANAVFAQGISYISAAGNSGDSSYESAFVSSGVAGAGGGTLHDFDPGPAVATAQQLTIPLGGTFTGSLQWDQAFKSLGGSGSSSDLDISLYGADGTTLLATSITNNVGGDPLELFGFFNDGSFDLDGIAGADTTFFLKIELVSGPAPTLMKYVDFSGQTTIVGFPTHSSTSIGHANTSGSLGVAAAAFFNTPSFGQTPPRLNDFSSLGGTQILFDASGNRLSVPFNPQSPQVTGVDGTNTTFFGDDIPQDVDAFPNFFGTSAAAPHVAAVAALLLDAAGGAGSLSPTEIYNALESTAIDITDRAILATGSSTPITNGTGFDTYSGFGLVDGVRAVQLVSTGISIADVAAFEGDSGTTAFVFAVSIAGAVAAPVSVEFATANGTALAGQDYASQSGTVTFTLGGATTQFITIQVLGDVEVEPNETFFVKLSNAENATIRHSQATGTIKNDDVDLSINDVTVLEGDTGTKNAVFTVTAFGSTDRTVSVSYTTLGGTAIAGADFLPAAGAITFAPGGGAAFITVPIVGDKFNESTETFLVQLLSPQGSQLSKSVGIGTILDNDLAPGLYVNDVFLTTISPGALSAIFTVALGTPSGQTVTVDYATADGTALAGVNYIAQAGVLTFAPGVATQMVTVPVIASGVYSPNEKFSLNLFNPVHAPLSDPQGIATIIFANPPINERIIDDGDPGYAQTAGWVNLTNTLAYQLDYDYHAAGTGANFATWTFDGLANGSYEVFAKWIAFGNRASNAPYTILDGATPRGTIVVNQQNSPTGDSSNGVTWQPLGLFSIINGTLTVRLADNANGYVVADAIRIVAGGIPPAAPEMDVAGSDHSIGTQDLSPTTDDGTDFGSVASASNSLTHTFMISNTGNADLHLTGAPRVAVSGANASDFTVLVQPGSSVAPGFQSTFQIMFHPSDVGLRQAVISIANDDGSEQPYVFAVRGTGVDTGPAQLTVDDLTSGFTAIGGWPANTNSLSFAGQHLSAAAGAGVSNASWEFHNLAPGTYEVLTTWTPFGNRATNASYQIADGNVSQIAVGVNQRQSPNDAFADGVMWESLALFQVTTGELTVRLNNNANGYVVADAVRIIRQGAAIAAVAPAVAHNSEMSLDVNGDTRITSSDALLIVNRLLAPQPAVSPLAAVASPLASSPGADATYYLDVNGDGRITPSDALAVIRYLLNPAPQAAPSVAPAVSVLVDQPAAVSPMASPLAAPSAAAVDQVIVQLDEPEPEPAVLPSTVEATSTAAVVQQPASTASPLLTTRTVRAYFAARAQRDPAEDPQPAEL